MKPYPVEYRHNGKTYVFDIIAESKEDARARLSSAYHNGEVQERVAKVRVW